MYLFKFHKKQKLYEHEFYVYRDWAVIAGSFIIFLVAIMVGHIFLFFKISEESLVDMGQEVTNPKSVDRVELKRVISVLEERRVLFEDMKKATSTTLVDPSR